MAQRQFSSAGSSKACYVPASGGWQLQLQLFVRAADGSLERSRLFPAMAELTSNCTGLSLVYYSLNRHLVLHCASAIWLSAQHSYTLAQHLWLFIYARSNTLWLNYCRLVKQAKFC